MIRLVTKVAKIVLQTKGVQKRMKLKKMLVLLFSMVLMLVVVACSNDEGGSTDKKDGDNRQS